MDPLSDQPAQPSFTLPNLYTTQYPALYSYPVPYPFIPYLYYPAPSPLTERNLSQSEHPPESTEKVESIMENFRRGYASYPALPYNLGISNYAPLCIGDSVTNIYNNLYSQPVLNPSPTSPLSQTNSKKRKYDEELPAESLSRGNAIETEKEDILSTINECLDKAVSLHLSVQKLDEKTPLTLTASKEDFQYGINRVSRQISMIQNQVLCLKRKYDELLPSTPSATISDASDEDDFSELLTMDKDVAEMLKDIIQEDAEPGESSPKKRKQN